MARETVITCDMLDLKGKPCSGKGVVEAVVTQDGKKYRTDLCAEHGQQLVNVGQPITVGAPATGTVIKLPRVTGEKRTRRVDQLVDKIDYPDMRAWLEAQGDLKAGSIGIIKKSLQEKWIQAGEPRPV